jgi:hypothetical protein
MGYANIPQGVGWAFGSWYAGSVYDRLGDKANLALDYLANNYNLTDVARTNAMDKLVEVTGMTHQQATNVLWDTYDPYSLWYRFAAIGLASAVGMLLYGMWVRRHEAPDV